MYVRNRTTINPITVTPDTTIATALEIMREKNINRIPVVKDGKLVGIITERKLMEVSPSSATSLSIFEINYLLAKTKVEQVMTKKVVTVAPDDLLEIAALKMRDNKVGGLPVVENGKVVGIMSVLSGPLVAPLRARFISGSSHCRGRQQDAERQQDQGILGVQQPRFSAGKVGVTLRHQGSNTPSNLKVLIESLIVPLILRG